MIKPSQANSKISPKVFLAWPKSSLVSILKTKMPLIISGLLILSFANQWLGNVVVNAATFTDSTQANFNTGTYFRTQWTAGASNFVTLTNPGKNALSGTYTSGVKDSGSTSTWNSLAWVPSQPYGKELPASLGVETAYGAANISMNGNIAYYRLNEANGTSFSDSSGNGNLGSCSGVTCPTLGVTGKLNGAVTFDGVQQIISTPNTFSNTLNTTSSLSFWIKTTQVSASANFYASPTVTGIEESGGGNDIFWGNLDNTGRISLVVGNSGGVKSTNPINDGGWHNVVMTRNATSGDARIYVDGTLNASAILDVGNKTNLFTSIGRLENTSGAANYVYFAGSLDEMALFNRVLTAAEASSIYTRGALNLLYQVRSCPTTACTGINFKGPDGTTSTYYSEALNDTINLPSFNLNNLNSPINRYFQYFVSFQTSDSNITPTLKSVTIDYSQYIPSVAFAIRNSADTANSVGGCNLGNLSTSSLNSCSYRLKITTNATNGYTVSVQTSGNLSNGANSFANAAAGTGGAGGTLISSGTSGTEGYGAVFTKNAITGGTITLNSIFNAGATNSIAINNTTSQNLATATGPNQPVNIDLANTILVTHNANISPATRPGNYTQNITYTVVPSY